MTRDAGITRGKQLYLSQNGELTIF